MKKYSILSRYRHVAMPLAMLLCVELQADPAAIQQTQSKLKKLNVQINQLQQTLSTAQDKRGLLNKNLAVTEKQIGLGVSNLRSIQQSINEKSFKISKLQNKIEQLNTQLSTQQKLLANHIRARYQMGEYQPLKWILNQEEPYKVSRILTYYQYMIHSREQLIEQIHTTRHHLNQNQETLNSELAQKQKLKLNLTKNQQQLEQNKSYHTALIHSLNNEIQNKELSLREAQKNKNNLAHLLTSLSSKKSITQTNKAFSLMRKKLPLPVHTATRSFKQMNQGVTFFADEGTAVTAVYPGKVVFSDWLKGYGLLLIIDHGQGYMSLYAHNESLFKKTGQMVQQNEQIASVGHSGGIKQNGLYFEIRLRGKAIPPFAWLA